MEGLLRGGGTEVHGAWRQTRLTLQGGSINSAFTTEECNGHTDIEVGAQRERLDTADGTGTAPQGRRDGQSTCDVETSGAKKNRGALTKKPRVLDLLYLF